MEQNEIDWKKLIADLDKLISEAKSQIQELKGDNNEKL